MAKKNSWQSWITCIISSLFLGFVIFQINSFNPLANALMTSFHLNAAQFGNLAACYFYGNVLFLIPAGLLLDRFPPKKILQLSMGSAVIATYAFAHASSLPYAVFCRIALGIAGSFAFLSAIRFNLGWFTQDKLAGATGVSVTLAMLGGACAQTPLTILLTHYNWRNALEITAIVGLVIWLLITCFVHSFPGSTSQVKAPPLKQSLKYVIGNARNWLAGLSICFLNMPMFVLGAGWGELFLTQYHHITPMHASWIAMALFLGSIIGSPTMGWVSDRFTFQREGWSIRCQAKPNRYQLMGVAAWCMAALLATALFLPHLSWLSLVIVFFALGFTSSAQVIGYPYVTEQNDKTYLATALGMTSTLVMSGGFIQPIFGWMLTWTHDVHWVNHHPFYSHIDYQIAMVLLFACFIATMLFGYHLKKYEKNAPNEKSVTV